MTTPTDRLAQKIEQVLRDYSQLLYRPTELGGGQWRVLRGEGTSRGVKSDFIPELTALVAAEVTAAVEEERERLIETMKIGIGFSPVVNRTKETDENKLSDEELEQLTNEVEAKMREPEKEMTPEEWKKAKAEGMKWREAMKANPKDYQQVNREEAENE